MKIWFRALFSLFSGMEGLSGNAFPKISQKSLEWFSDGPIRQRSLAPVSAQAIQCIVQNLLLKLRAYSFLNVVGKMFTLCMNANNLSIEVKLAPEIQFYLNLKTVLIKWHNVCPNI